MDVGCIGIEVQSCTDIYLFIIILKNNWSLAHGGRVIWVAPQCESKTLKDALSYLNVTRGKKHQSTKNIIFKRFVVILAYKQNAEL